MIPMENNPAAAWICALAGIVLHGAALARSLGKRGKLSPKTAAVLLLPGLLGLLSARGGFELLGWDTEYASFRWCYTTGLLGLAAGTALAARAAGAKILPALDETAAAACLCMAAARLSQRWLGETGVGPILENEGILTMINEWEEPVLAAWIIETGICLLAAAATAVLSRRRPRAAGGTFCAAVHFLMNPQILAEQFRSGEYLKFMMMRLEQALFALAGLGTLIWLCERYRRAAGGSGAAAYAPAAGYLAAAGIIALSEFMLDGKLIEAPASVSWALFGAAAAGRTALAVYAVRRRDRKTGGTEEN